MAVGSLSNLLNSFAVERTGKLGAGENALRQVIGLFDKGSGNMQNELADVNENLISRGLGSTTRPVVASVGMKAKYNDIRKSRLADALSALANYLGQTAPTSPTISNLAMGTNQVLRSAMPPIVGNTVIDGSVRSSGLFSNMPMYSTPR